MTLLPQLDHLQRWSAHCLAWVRGAKLKLSCGNPTVCRDDACILTKSIRKSMHLLHLPFLNARLLLKGGMQVQGLDLFPLAVLFCHKKFPEQSFNFAGILDYLFIYC